MLIYAITLFAITAVGGLILAANVLKGKLASWKVSIVHALFAGAGILTLIIFMLNGSSSGQVAASLGLYVVAAIGGFYLVSFHKQEKIAPKSVVIIHAGVAVAGTLTLLSAILNM